MVSDHIRQALKTQPFQPFELNLADGRRLLLKHPEFLYVPPRNERTVFFTHEDGNVEVVDALLIVSLKPVGSVERRRRAG